MKKLILFFLCIVVTQFSYSQNGQLPPINFSLGKNVCDNNPWQLVFQDYFNGTQLQSPWITFLTWNDMDGGDHDNSDEA